MRQSPLGRQTEQATPSRRTVYHSGMSKKPSRSPASSHTVQEAREDLEKQATFLRSIVSTAVDGVIAIDEVGIIHFFSPTAERIFGYDAKDVLGQNVKLLMPEHHAQEHDSYLERYRKTGDNRIIGIGRQLIAKRNDGTEFPIDLAVSEFFVDGRRMFTGLVRDITDRVEAESAARHAAEELQQVQKMEAIGQLTGGIAHDFNNLLTVIFGNLEMLETELEDESQRFLLSEAQEAAELGAELTDRLLAFARRQPLEPKLIDLNAIVTGMGDLLARSLPESIRIQFALSDQPCRARVDPGQMENTVLNLAINARDAMPEGGHPVTTETGGNRYSRQTGRRREFAVKVRMLLVHWEGFLSGGRVHQDVDAVVVIQSEELIADPQPVRMPFEIGCS